MYFIDEIQNIHINRGDQLDITLNNSTTSFSQGDQIKFSIMRKGDASEVIFQKTFTIDERCSKYVLTLSSEDTRLENIIKTGTVVYWYEIEYNGQHIGWVSHYFDLEYLDNKERIPAIGIDIPEKSIYNRGVGTEALKQFMDYLSKAGYKHFYIQTWSGNKRMLHVAEKLGFKVYFVKKNHRLINNEMYDAVTLLK